MDSPELAPTDTQTGDGTVAPTFASSRMTACSALSGDSRERLISALMRVTLLMFPVVFRVGLSLSACQPVSGKMVLVEQPTVRCDTPEHRALQAATVTLSVVSAIGLSTVAIWYLHGRLATLDAFVAHIGAGE